MSETYAVRVGATFLGVMNDLKRDGRTAARELSVPVEMVMDIIQGKMLPPRSLVERATEVWPVNERDFFPVHDDCPDGLMVMTSQESVASSRTIERGGRPYYEYRDTAMSRVSSLRPEWIEMLLSVGDESADNPAVRWNNGHLLFQFTYFVGKVNYYYEWEGDRFCRAMNTGDSVFGLPYAKHSFTKRDRGEQAFILALTYGGRLSGDAQHELSALGPSLAAEHAIGGASGAERWAALLRLHLANAEISLPELARRSGSTEAHAAALASGAGSPSEEDVHRLASALQVAPRELMVLEPDVKHGVVLLPGSETPTWCMPSEGRTEYRMKRLATSCVTPFARSLEVDVLRREGDPVRHRLRSSLHEYGYNVGALPSVLQWTHGGQSFRRMLFPGDSYYVKPFVPHLLSIDATASAASGEPRIVILRAGGKIVGDAGLEASVIGAKALSRIAEDHRRWFDDGTDESGSTRGQRPGKGYNRGEL